MDAPITVNPLVTLKEEESVENNNTETKANEEEVKLVNGNNEDIVNEGKKDIELSDTRTDN